MKAAPWHRFTSRWLVLYLLQSRGKRTGARLCTRDPPGDLRLTSLLPPWPLPLQSSSGPAFHARSCSIDILESCKGGAGGPSLGVALQAWASPSLLEPLPPVPMGPSAPCPVPAWHWLLLNQRWVQAPQCGERAWGGSVGYMGGFCTAPCSHEELGKRHGGAIEEVGRRGQSGWGCWGPELGRPHLSPWLGWVLTVLPGLRGVLRCHPGSHVPPFAVGLPLPCRGVLTTPPHAVPCHVSSLPRWAPCPSGDSGGLMSMWLCHTRVRAPLLPALLLPCSVSRRETKQCGFSGI